MFKKKGRGHERCLFYYHLFKKNHILSIKFIIVHFILYLMLIIFSFILSLEVFQFLYNITLIHIEWNFNFLTRDTKIHHRMNGLLATPIHAFLFSLFT